jgi:hypothetical protein
MFTSKLQSWDTVYTIDWNQQVFLIHAAYSLILVNCLLGHLYFLVLQGEGDGRGNLNTWNSCVPLGLESLALCDGSMEACGPEKGL